MKKFLVLMLSTVLFFSGCEKKNTQNGNARKTIKIGAILPESHKDFSSYAKQLKKGMMLANELINKDNNITLNIVYEDGFGIPNKSISAMKKLIDIENPKLIIGPMFSHTAESLAPIAQKTKTILLSPTASSIKLSEAGKYFFRIYPSDSYDGTFLANFINHKFKNKTVAILAENTSSINQIVNVFKENLQNKIIYEEKFNENVLNNALSTVVTKIKELSPDVIFFPGNKTFMTMFLKKVKEHNLKSNFITISTFNDKKILDKTKETSENVIFSTPAFNPKSNTEEMEIFVKEYKKKYNEDPDILAGYGYDVVNIAYKALKQSSNIDESIKNLLAIKDYLGITGKTTFKSNGDVDKTLQMMSVKNGKFIAYE